MNDFLDIMAQYYRCDATASLRPMPSADYAACMDIFHQVKAWFLPHEPAPPGTSAHIEQMRMAYLGFLDLQEANPDLVADMRAEAAATTGYLALR